MPRKEPWSGTLRAMMRHRRWNSFAGVGDPRLDLVHTQHNSITTVGHAEGRRWACKRTFRHIWTLFISTRWRTYFFIFSTLFSLSTGRGREFTPVLKNLSLMYPYLREVLFLHHFIHSLQPSPKSYGILRPFAPSPLTNTAFSLKMYQGFFWSSYPGRCLCGKCAWVTV